jgi:hypothetical protein
LLFRPDLVLRGGRLLFGDHAMFFRRSDFLAVGGCDAALAIMEDADLCIRLSRLGRVRLIGRRVETSDRRIAAWGPLRANWIYLSIASGGGWGSGASSDAAIPTYARRADTPLRRRLPRSERPPFPV